METPEVTRAEDVLEVQEVVVLPRQQMGRTLVFRIRALRTHEYVAAARLVPGLATSESSALTTEQMLERVLSASEANAAIAIAGVVEPKLSLNEDPGKVCWWHIHPANQTHIVQKITALAGGNDEAATRAATFPENAGGPAGGGTSGQESEGGGGATA